MTFSILVRDPETGALGGAAATGSLCVGGWVLRGDIRAGLSASQGAAPSTFWGEDVLTRMRAGRPADAAVAEVTGADPGRAARQLSALDLSGQGAHFTGADNTPQMAGSLFPQGVAAGNMLADAGVVDALAEGFAAATGPLSLRLLAGLRAAEAAGSDSRGLLSAALLVLRHDHAPLTLRIDYHEGDPIGALEALHDRATSGAYADWARQVPSPEDPTRVLDRLPPARG
ncbi:DUF1028 domain-containing protein [Pseudoponticoccus marisrubri]|uniref:Fimbrial assembly protein FimA n=1 Tax=Pseudoponticoccus marisrubri TaxID=1685382 RepID=A0A0W7WFN1_9RHOB|nr:DUF1028 domain-containing protein [Pseudoponticoccus marisrubri]KUF09389.1 fimbrial assembly protein FimA [Pseudoponticoccus marisrubri]